MASASFQLSSDGGSTYLAADTPMADANVLAYVASGTYSIKARLASTAGVGAIQWAITSADDVHYASLPTVTTNPDKSCSFVVPKTGGAWILRCVVNGGVNLQTGAADATLDRSMAVKVLNAATNQEIAVGEQSEANATTGYTKAFNDIARNIAGVGSLAGDVSGPTAANTVEKIQNLAVSVAGIAAGKALVSDGSGFETSTNFRTNVVQAGGYQAPSSSPFSFSSAAVSYASDANKTLSASEYNCHDLTVTSAVSLTATRNLVVPLTDGGTWRVYNGTTGAQSIQVIGSSGTGVTIANGAWGTVRANGTNVVSVAAAGGGGSTPTGTGFVHVTAGVQDAAAALVVNADVDAAAAIVPTKFSLGSANTVLYSDGATNSWSSLPIVSRVDVTSSYRVNGIHALGFSTTTLKLGSQATWTSLLTDVGSTCTLDYAWGGTTYLTLSQAAAAVTASVAAGASSFTLQHAQDATTSGGNFTIKAQDAAGGGNGGLLILAAGDKDAAGTPGYIAFYCYGANQYYVSCGTGGLLLAPDKDAGAVTMQQVANTTNSATASNTTLQAQNATGTTAVGGDLTCASGTGTSRAGNLFLTASGSGGTAGYVACTSNNQEIWRCAVDGTFLVKYAGSQIMASDTSSQIGIKSLKGLAGNPFKLAYLDKSIAAGGTITLANTEYDYADINLSGAQASATTVVFPATIGATWRVTNNATAAYGVALQASGGSRLVHVGRAQTVEVRCDGAELYVVNGKPPVVVLAEGLIDYNGTSGTNTDTTLYTFPANAFGIITSVELVLDTAQTGATSVCTLTVGDTAGGTQWIVSQTIDTSTAVDTDYGLTLTHLGTNFDAARGYVYVKPRATSKSIIARCARSVATVTAGKLRYRVIGSVSW